MLEERAGDGRDHADPEADGDDIEIVAIGVVVGPCQNADPGCQHHAEHHDAGPPQHEGRDGGDHHRHLGDKAKGEQDPPGHHADPAARYSGHAHQPDILGERGVGEAVEDTAYDGADGIHPQPAYDIAATGWVTNDVTERQKHPHRLDKGNEHDHRQGGDGDGIEGGPTKGERYYGGKPGRLTKTVETHLPHGDGYYEAEDDPEQHRDIAEKTFGEAGHSQNEGEHHKAGADIAQAAIFGVAFAPRHPVDPHLHDADPDGGDDHPGDHGREERHQPAYQRHQQG